ncbi:hypothetical protein O181_027361, partial [Austropuccinia psidii MF-1]|nr:hypothetical protein [Austropuccinia psidii MF-1]
METCCIVHNFLIGIIESAKKQTLENTQLPKDVRTMMKILNIEPQLKELICCEKCYSLYEGANTSEYCTYQPFPKSTICNTPLFSIKTPFRSIKGQELGISSSSRYQSHNPYQVYLPKTIYYTQDMLEWVKWLLGLPNIELKIYEWQQQLSTMPYVNDIQQAQAWKNLQWADCQEGNENCLCLTFSLFIDCFNPRGNKQAGKQESMGLLLLTCLNLPPKLRHKPAYSFVFGVIPGPNSPNTITISNILKPLVDQLLVLKDGVKIPTFLQPQGINIYVQLLPLIGDLVAIHKTSGVASHSGTHFCPWCDSQLPNLQLMKLGTTRNGLTILKAAQDWKDARTLTEQDDLRKKNGVQWSQLDRLPYRNPNMHLALGILHNWLEGVLAEHFRFRWGFQDDAQEKKRALNQKSKKNKRRCVGNFEGRSLDSNGDSSECEDDLGLGQGIGGGFFTSENIEMFRYLLQDIVLPSGIGKIPKNLGASKNGRLKASDWLTLFTLIIPLVVLEMFFEGEDPIEIKSNRALFLQNTGDLVQCTRIACTKTIKEGHAGRFANAYERYTKSSKRLFNNPIIKPNHHYALHIPQQLKLWGPLFGVAEFTGERLIGILQKHPTNNRIREMHGTMMKRVNAMQKMVGQHLEIKEYVDGKLKKQKKSNYNVISMSYNDYEALFSMLIGEGMVVCKRNLFSHPPNTFVLTRHARRLPFLKHNDVPIGSMPPNNAIIFKNNRIVSYGLVMSIFEFRGPNFEPEIAILINLVTLQFSSNRFKPGQLGYYFNLFGILCAHLNEPSHQIFIRPSQILGTAAYRHLSPDTFGIAEAGILLCPQILID